MIHWDLALIVIFLALVVPWMGRRRVRQLMMLPRTTKAERLSLYASTTAFQWLLAALVLWRVTADGIAPRQLGLQLPNPWFVAIVSAVLVGLIIANQVYSLRRMAAARSDQPSVLRHLAIKVFPQDAAERLAFFALVVTVALCEEWIYRGFVQGVFERWGSSVLVGILGSAILFAAAHAYQGPRGLFATFVVAVLFSAARLWTGSLAPSIAAHFAADLTAGFLAPSTIMASMRAEAATVPREEGRPY